MQARGLKGTIRYYGTPAEEGGGGKIYMLHAGLFRDVDAVLAWHPADANRVNLGSLLANNGGRFRFYGVASHAAAAPERGRSALDGLMIMLNAVEFLREHVPQETRIHYVITNGGAAANIVPAFAEANLIARNPDAQVLDGIWERIMNCARAGALASGTRMEFVQGTNYANVLPNDALEEVLARAMQKAGGYEYTPAEHSFAQQLQKTLGFDVKTPGPDHVQTSKSETVEPGVERCRRCELGGSHRAIHRGHVRARRERAHVAGGGVCRIEHRAEGHAGGGAHAGAGGSRHPRSPGRSDGSAGRLHQAPGRPKVDHARAGGWEAGAGLCDEVGGFHRGAFTPTGVVVYGTRNRRARTALTRRVPSIGVRTRSLECAPRCWAVLLSEPRFGCNLPETGRVKWFRGLMALSRCLLGCRAQRLLRIAYATGAS